MLRIENKFIGFVQKHIFWIFAILALEVSILLRVVLLPCYSADINQFLIPWYNEIVEGGGLQALAHHSANYNTAYLFLLFLATKLPFEPINAIKFFSILADYFLAGVVAALVCRKSGDFKKKTMVFLLTSLLPLCIFNSSYWGQCDSIYVAFLLLAVYFALQDKWARTFLFFGIGFAFKLQAIFLLPMLIILYVTKRKFTLFNFLIPPLVVLVSGLPAIVYGADVLKPFAIYLGQVEDSGWVFVNYYNVSSFFRWHGFELMGKFLVIATIFICFSMMAYALWKKLTFAGDSLILLGAWSAICCVLFLPGMHERYGYAGELLLWVWFLRKPSRRRFVPFITFYLLGFMASSRFLFGTWPEDSPFLGLLNLANFCLITVLLIKDAAPGKLPGRVLQPAKAAVGGVPAGPAVPDDLANTEAVKVGRDAANEPAEYLKEQAAEQEYPAARVEKPAQNQEIPSQ